MRLEIEKLTKVAWDAGEEAISRIGTGYQGGLTEDAAESIVRAVLAAFPSRDFVEAVARRYENGDPGEYLSTFCLEMALNDEISHILSEPATA